MADQSDFRIVQSYDEIREAIYEHAVEELTSDGDPTTRHLPPTAGQLAWARSKAQRIADRTMMGFDAE